MSVFNEFMRMIEQRPEVKKISEHLGQLEEQIRRNVSDESWKLILRWEEVWAQYLVVTSRAMFPAGVEEFDLEGLPYQEIQVMIPCEDECRLCEGVKISSSLALIREQEEHQLFFCKIEGIPGSNVYRVRRPSHPLMQHRDHFLPVIATDMHNMTFAQFAQKYEAFLADALLAE